MVTMEFDLYVKSGDLAPRANCRATPFLSFSFLKNTFGVLQDGGVVVKMEFDLHLCKIRGPCTLGKL